MKKQRLILKSISTWCLLQFHYNSYTLYTLYRHCTLLYSPIQNLWWSQCTSLWQGAVSKSRFKGWALLPSFCVFFLFQYIFLVFTTSSVFVIIHHSVVSSTDETLNNEKRLLLLWVGLLVTLHTFVFTHITSVVKPVHIFMARSRVSKSRSKSWALFLLTDKGNGRNEMWTLNNEMK